MDLTAQQRKDIRDRVTAGAVFLDKEYPDWRTDLRHTIDGDSPLDMSDCKACVLGRLMDDYFHALDFFFPGLSEHEREREACALGFTLPPVYGLNDQPAWRYLEQCWLE